MDITITAVVALTGVVTGTAGLVLGILNYLRDRPQVLVKVKWDMSVTDNPVYDPKKKWAIVSVTNVGRRPIYISHSSFELPKGYDHTHLLIWQGIHGQKLAEGDAPVDYIVSQEGFEKYKKDWRKIRVVVFDSAGKAYKSKAVDKKNFPSWAR